MSSSILLKKKGKMLWLPMWQCHISQVVSVILKLCIPRTLKWVIHMQWQLSREMFFQFCKFSLAHFHYIYILILFNLELVKLNRQNVLQKPHYLIGVMAFDFFLQDYQCVWPEVWKWGILLARCSSAHNYWLDNSSNYSYGIVGCFRCWQINNTMSHCTADFDTLVSYILQGTFWICFCEISIAG